MKLKIEYDPAKLTELKKILKKRYPQLTEADLFSKEGSESDMFRMLEYKLGKTKSELQALIARL